MIKKMAAMSISIETALITAIVCALLALIAYWRRVFDIHGTYVAFLVGLVIGILGSLLWLIMLLVFLLSSFLATKFKFDYKKQKGVQEGVRGERKVKNILANGSIPVIVACFKFFYPLSEPFATVLFLTAISAAAADTMASELGTLSGNTYLITDLTKKVPPGTNGGVSVLGTLAALFAAFYVSLVGCILSSVFNLAFFIIPVLLGFLSCNIDSLLGATLEVKGMMTKQMVNYISIGTSTVICVLVWIKLSL